VRAKNKNTKSNFATLNCFSSAIPLIFILILIVCIIGHYIDHGWKVPETSLYIFNSYIALETSSWSYFRVGDRRMWCIERNTTKNLVYFDPFISRVH
jgi:hypothetical protein